MSKEELYEAIERYQAGGMSETEKTDFEAQVQREPEWQQELALHAQLQAALSDSSTLQFIDTLKAVDARWANPGAQKRVAFMHWPFIRAAAAIALLLLGYWYFQSRGPEKPEALFAANFQAYELVLNNRAAGETSANPLLDTAMQAYLAKDYAAAASAFSLLAATAPGNHAWPFYQGMALLASGKPRDAIRLFESILNQSPILFQEQARWYLGLAYLAAREPDYAISTLSQIPPGAYQYEAAQQILKALR